MLNYLFIEITVKTMTVFIWHREVPYQTRKTEKSIIAKCN
nr:MAG TPA: hypothetical protein [Caudoviricetes sp.]DAJ54165.1 MAG TPA: hypothetical protein [Caudoviricetes sp.]